MYETSYGKNREQIKYRTSHIATWRNVCGNRGGSHVRTLLWYFVKAGGRERRRNRGTDNLDRIYEFDGHVGCRIA